MKIGLLYNCPTHCSKFATRNSASIGVRSCNRPNRYICTAPLNIVESCTQLSMYRQRYSKHRAKIMNLSIYLWGKSTNETKFKAAFCSLSYV